MKLIKALIILALTTVNSIHLQRTCACDDELLGNGFCNKECNNVICNWDGFDCTMRANSDCLFVQLASTGCPENSCTEKDRNIINELNVQCNWRLSSLKIYWTDNLAGISFEYNNDDQAVTSQWYGSSYAEPSAYQEHLFYANEFIVTLETESDGTYFRYFYFETNLGRVVTYGTPNQYKRYRAEIPSDSYIIGFITRGVSYVYRLTPIIPANPAGECACGARALGDQICTELCNTEACFYDGGDCNAPDKYEAFTELCNCDQDLLRNGLCNTECNNFDCYFDGLDCVIESSKGCNFGLLGIVGEWNYQKQFNDILDLNVSCDWVIKGLNIYFSSYLQNIQVVYEHDNKIVRSSWRGGSAPSSFDQHDFSIGEVITKISGTVSTYLYRFTITTNKGRVIDYGSNYGQYTEVLVPAGYVLGAFGGYYSGSIVTLETYVMFAPGQQNASGCFCESDQLGNGKCEEDCNVVNCDFDGLDCAIRTSDECYLAEISTVGASTLTGNTFDDVRRLGIECNWRISDIYIYHSSYLQGIGFSYWTGSSIVDTDLHSVTTDRSYFTRYTLEPNEFITHFSGHESGNYFYHVLIKTNLGRRIEYGSTTSYTPYDAKIPHGSYLLGISGLQSSQQYRFTVYSPAFPKETCACGEDAIGDGICTELCNTAACNYEGGDCNNVQPVEEYAPQCTCDLDLVQNGFCNQECNSQECMFDGLDCAIQVTDDCKLVLQNTIGQTAGTNKFNDIEDIRMGCDWKISAIEVLFTNDTYYGTYMIGLRTEYTSPEGDVRQTKQRGNYGNSEARAWRFELAPNEFITRVSGLWSTYIYQLRFHTNLGRSEVFGTNNGTPFDYRFGYGTHLAAFGGEENYYFYKLDLYTSTGDSDICNCLPEALNDGFCTEECKIPGCNYDSTDCANQVTFSAEQLAHCTCNTDLLHNGVCNPECGTKSCLYDGGDCEIESSNQENCRIAKIYKHGQRISTNDLLFNDIKSMNISCDYRLKSIIWSDSSYITGIQSIYDNKGSEIKSNWNSKSTYGAQTLYQVDLLQNEFITGMRIYTTVESEVALYSEGITFTTSFGRKISKGEFYDTYVDIPIEKGDYLIGFGGSFDSYLTHLEIYVVSSKDVGCPCSEDSIGDGTCIDLCNTAGCNYDGGDCVNQSNPLQNVPYCSCRPNLFANGYCDPECDGLICQWDGLDCTIKAGDCNFGILKTAGDTNNPANKFNDINEQYLGCNTRLTGLDIYYSSYIQAIRATYKDGTTTKQGKWHGLSYDPSSYDQYYFAQDEYVTKIRGTFDGSYFNSMTITTNKGQKIQYGNDSGQVFEYGFGGDFNLAAIGGSWNSYLDQLDFYVVVNPDITNQNFCACDESLLGNGHCNVECNNLPCNWDGLDCALEQNNGCLFSDVATIGVDDKSPYFNDVQQLNMACNWRIKTLKIYWSSYLCGIQTEYDNGGRTVSSQWHYSYNAALPSTYTEHNFGPNEFIISIQGYYYANYYFQYLRFYTNLGRVIEYGTQQGEPFTLNFPQGSYLAGIAGQSNGSYINRLTFYAKTNEETACSCGGRTGGDGICTELCNTAVCAYDGGDCESPVDPDSYAPYCPCDESLLHNGLCNTECDNFQCQNDGLDCAVNSKGCQFGKVGKIGNDYKTPEFSDVTDLDIGCDWKIKSLFIYWSSQLYNIRVIYVDAHEKLHRSPWRGNSSAPSTYDRYDFASNEYIVRIATNGGSSGIVNLEIETNVGRLIKYTKYPHLQLWHNMRVPEGMVVAALGGNANTSYVYSLIMYVNYTGSGVDYRQNAITAGNNTGGGNYTGTFGYGSFTGGYKPYGGGSFGGFGGFGGTGGSHVSTNDGTPRVPEGYGKYKKDGSFDLSTKDQLKYCKCGLENIGNSTCDQDCFNFECGYDGGDCGKFVIGCDCPVSKLGDGVCDQNCNTFYCLFDNGDCKKYPNCECDISLLGNNDCDISCFNSDCNYDEGDCGTPIKGCDCPISWLGNGTCNELCNNAECFFDKGDCEQFPDCKCDTSKIRNGVCDVECFNRDCIFDGGDCGAPFKGCPCPRVKLLNGRCDEECNVEGCKFDNGACL